MDEENISVKNYYWMLAYAFNTLNVSDSEKISSEEFENIYELFCFILTNELNKQIKRGLNKTYVPYEEETQSVKGKININETLNQLSFLKKKLCIEFDDYSIDSKLNQIVKTAAYFLLKSGHIKTKKYINNLTKSLKYLGDVKILKPNSIKWNNIRYDRNNSSYRMLINVSYFTLNGLLSTKEDGTFEFNKYIDGRKMYRLYEKFILGYYRYHYNNFINAGAPSIDWITDNYYMLPNMYSDVILCNRKNNNKLIIDAKYYSNAIQENEFYNRETFKSNNLYQIFTYVKNEDKNKDGSVSGMLLYAKTKYNDNIEESYNLDGNKITITNLDLSHDFKLVSNKLNKIADDFLSLVK